MKLEAIYCINLDHRTDRWKQVQEEFRDLPIPVTRFSAIQETPGWVGCRKSHMAVLDLCKNLKTFMVLEDDCRFIPGAMDSLHEAVAELPDNWDMLYLGANLFQPVERHSPHLFRLKWGYTTHAMIFNNPKMVQFILSAEGSFRKIDVFYQEVLQEKYNVYITCPMIATQAGSYSDITHRHNDYSSLLRQKFNSFTGRH